VSFSTKVVETVIDIIRCDTCSNEWPLSSSPMGWQMYMEAGQPTQHVCRECGPELAAKAKAEGWRRKEKVKP
jgi:hypothetical protein